MKCQWGDGFRKFGGFQVLWTYSSIQRHKLREFPHFVGCYTFLNWNNFEVHTPRVYKILICMVTLACYLKPMYPPPLFHHSLSNKLLFIHLQRAWIPMHMLTTINLTQIFISTTNSWSHTKPPFPQTRYYALYLQHVPYTNPYRYAHQSCNT